MNVPVPSVANGGDYSVQSPPQLVQSHTPIENPHGEARRCGVKHGAGMQADDNDHDDAEDMSEIEQVEVLPPYRW